jgi:hypothetical protein
MNLMALKNPIVLIVLIGSVFVTNLVTYNVASPSSDQCQAVLDAILNQQAKAEAEHRRALGRPQNLNPNRGGGINWNEPLRP